MSAASHHQLWPLRLWPLQPLNTAPSAALADLSPKKFLNVPNNNPDLTPVRRWRRWRACTGRIHSWGTRPAWSLRSQKLPSTSGVSGESSPSMRWMHTLQLYTHLYHVIKHPQRTHVGVNLTFCFVPDVAVGSGWRGGICQPHQQ